MKTHIRKRPALPLNALRAFEAAARLGRATAAADELGVTHGAVSRQIAHLEEALSLDLWGGTRSRPELTEAGRQLSAVLTDAFDRIDHGIRAVRADDDGVLHVACLSSFAVRFLIPRLHRFNERHPQIDVQISTTNLESGDRRQRFDLAITVVDGKKAMLATDCLLLRERIGVVTSPQRVAKLPLRRLTTRTRSDAWAQWEALGGKPGDLSISKSMLEFEHYHFAIQAASSGLGACVVPWHLVADDVKDGRLAAPNPFLETGYCYVLCRAGRSGRSADYFADWLRTELDELPV